MCKCGAALHYARCCVTCDDGGAPWGQLQSRDAHEPLKDSKLEAPKWWCTCSKISHTICAGRSCTGGKTEDFQAAARLLHRAGGRVVVPTFLVPATQKVWADVYGQPLPDCGGLTAAQVRCRRRVQLDMASRQYMH